MPNPARFVPKALHVVPFTSIHRSRLATRHIRPVDASASDASADSLNSLFVMRTLFLLLLLILGLPAVGQQCIRFDEPDLSRMPLLSRTVSIDRRDGIHYTAYANDDELRALEALGYSYTVVPPDLQPKALGMATTLDDMRRWQSYPTYDVYVEMMHDFVLRYPHLCSLDTIGTTVQGRQLLAVHLFNHSTPSLDALPQFFYTSTMHGDELTGYYLLLRLIDTLLAGYETNPLYHSLLNSVDVCINPLANPDGTYLGGNNTVARSQRYNANNVDLNRNFPDPFGTAPFYARQPEVQAMMDYAERNHFLVSANLHGGSEVLNYPWDSFTSFERPHPDEAWWKAVCQRFIDTLRLFSTTLFTDENDSGYIAGGDWYVISNGRQDYMNYYHDCREMTMELSVTKRLPSEQLETYWRMLQRPMVNYIREVLALAPTTPTPATPAASQLTLAPNPTDAWLHLSSADPSQPVRLYDLRGQALLTFPAGTERLDLRSLPSGIYLIRVGDVVRKVVRR